MTTDEKTETREAISEAEAPLAHSAGHASDTGEGDPSEPSAGLIGVQEERFFCEGESEVDPELVALPRSSRRRRHPVISLLVICLSFYLMFFFRDKLFFFLQPRRPADLGEASVALKEGRLRPNTYVELSGAPDRKHALILEAPFGGYESVFRLLQTSNKILVQQHRETRSTDEIVSSRHRGQLARFSSLAYHQGVRDYFAKTMTVPHDFGFGQLAEAKATRTATLVDREGVTVELTPDSTLWINAATPGEWWIQFAKRSYEKIEDAQRLLGDVKLPMTVEEEESASFWRFVVHADPREVAQLLLRFKDPSLRADVVQRQVSYSAHWDQLTIEGKNLLINAADPTFPTQYKRVSTPTGTKLVAAKDIPVRVPAEAILFITISSPFQIAPDALVLLTDRHPDENWYVALLYLVFLTFVGLNGLALVQRFRGRDVGRS
jgi:hypothetical protein